MSLYFSHFCWKLFPVFFSPILYWFSHHRSDCFSFLYTSLNKEQVGVFKSSVLATFPTFTIFKVSALPLVIPACCLPLFQTHLKFLTTSYTWSQWCPLCVSNPVHPKLHLPLPQISFCYCLSTLDVVVISTHTFKCTLSLTSFSTTTTAFLPLMNPSTPPSSVYCQVP